MIKSEYQKYRKKSTTQDVIKVNKIGREEKKVKLKQFD